MFLFVQVKRSNKHTKCAKHTKHAYKKWLHAYYMQPKSNIIYKLYKAIKLYTNYLQHIVIKNPAITKHAAIKRLNAPIPGIGNAGFK